MRLTRKLIFAIGLGICVILAINAWFRVELDRTRYETDIVDDHRILARALAQGVELLTITESELLASEIVEAVNARESNITVRWVHDAYASGPNGPRFPVRFGDDERGARSRVAVEHGERYLVTQARVRIPGYPVGAIEIIEDLEPEEAFTHTNVKRTVVVSGVLISLCLVLLVGFGTYFVGRPLKMLTEQARRIGEGEVVPKLKFKQDDEIRELAEEMNAMYDRLEAAKREITKQADARLEAVEQLRHADRLRTIGELASGIAHELGTPLNVIRARGMMIASGEASEQRSKELGAVVVDQADRMTRIIRELLDFARRAPARKESIELVRWTSSIAALVETLAEKAHVTLSIEPHEGSVLVDADPHLLLQALTNLVVNAIHSTPEGGSVRVTVTRERVVPPEEHGGKDDVFVAIHVDDTGVGIAAEHVARIFEPYFTTKKPGEGTGLGLSIARDIVHEHGGFLTFRSAVGEGSRFSIYLPERKNERSAA